MCDDPEQAIRDRLTSFVDKDDGTVWVYDHERGLSPRIATEFERDLRTIILTLLRRLGADYGSETNAHRSVRLAAEAQLRRECFDT